MRGKGCRRRGAWEAGQGGRRGAGGAANGATGLRGQDAAGRQVGPAGRFSGGCDKACTQALLSNHLGPQLRSTALGLRVP